MNLSMNGCDVKREGVKFTVYVCTSLRHSLRVLSAGLVGSCLAQENGGCALWEWGSHIPQNTPHPWCLPAPSGSQVLVVKKEGNKSNSGDFPGGSVVKALRSHGRGCGFDPWSGN